MAETQTTEVRLEEVTIPEFTLLGDPYPPILINFDSFEPGKSYRLDPVLAGEIRRIIAVKEEEDLKIIQPNRRKREITAEMRKRNINLM